MYVCMFLQNNVLICVPTLPLSDLSNFYSEVQCFKYPEAHVSVGVMVMHVNMVLLQFLSKLCSTWVFPYMTATMYVSCI